MDYFKLLSVFFVIWLGVNAEQPQIYVHNNNLVVQAPFSNYIQLKAATVKINDINLFPTLYEAQNATKLLRNYEMFISQFNTKMDDMESRLIGIGQQNVINTSSVPSNYFMTTIRRLSNKILLLQRNVRTLQTLLTRDECASNPCKNGGKCFDIYNGFLCQCPTGWEGSACEIDINECARFIGTDLGCQNGGTCLNLPGTYQCQCINGWIGVHCNRKKSDCNSGGHEICGHGTCISQNNEVGYKCLCDQGWKTDDVHMSCTVDVDECKQNHPPCSTNPLVQCINLPGSFTCQHCPQGYSGNGYYCADINECELFNGGCSVSPYVECINILGSRKCGPCPAGYEGDGKICTYKGVCNINNGGCNMLARCVPNTAISDSYVQCLCPAGYTGSGIGPTGCTRSSLNINPTTITSCTPNPCMHGSCVSYGLNQSESSFTCICDRSFTGLLCDQRKHPCSPNPCLNGGTCQSQGERFTCSCPAGYIGRNCGRQRSACGGTFNSLNGTVIYPPVDFESFRGREPLSCAWTIKTDDDKVIQVNFTKFNFADAPCTTQWFQLHDGRNSLSPALGRFCGSTLPLNGSLTTTQNILYFWLRTVGQSPKRPEFQLSWITKNPDCGSTLNRVGVGMITSPGWPNNYPKNRECSWRYNVPVGKRLLFHVYSLNIGQDSDCTGDYLEFYADSENYKYTMRTKRTIQNKQPELYAKFCNSTVPEPFYSLFPSGHIKFKSNEKDTYQGFQIGYSIVDGIPGCGGTYTNKDGYIQSVEVTSSMPDPLICEYEINLSASVTIKLEIVEIDMEENCWDTYVAIYLESDSGTSLITKTCGNRIPGPIVTYGKNVLIKSQSKYTHKNHWRIKYETVCHQTYTEPVGTIIIDSSTCSYLIQQPAGNIIILDMELGGSYQRFFAVNSVKVYDGDNENATLLGYYHHWSDKKIKIESSANYLLITTNQVFPRIFSATYTTLDLGCGGFLKNELGTGTISYPPGGIETYPGNKKCRWVIMAPPQKVIQLTWMTFNIEQSFDCHYDNVQVFDNNTEGLGGLLGKYCGFTLPPVMLSSSNIMTIDFTSDNSIHGEGFLVAYNFIAEKNVCGGNYFTPAGVIKSPGYPKNYPTNRECIWIIKVNPGSQIMLKFTNFSLESYSSCRYDWLEIRNGGTSSSPLIGKYCGTTYPKTIPSHTNKLYLKFNSDMSKTARGFRIEWSSAATGCGGTLSSPSGSIMSPHYPEPYAKNTECLWKITVSAGSKIQLIFADLDLEKHSKCGLDYIQLYDGSSINSKSLGKFCSPQIAPVISTLNNVLVRFRSDVSFQGRGFNLQYSTICTNTMKGFRGVIESPNFPNDYPQDQNCVWDISVSPGNKINISFSHFNLERSLTLENKSCAFDYVELEYGKVTSDYDDNELIWQVYDRYCGDRSPGFVTLDSNRAKIHFVSDSLLLGTGFRLEWQLFGCGGVLANSSGKISSPNYPKPYPENIECHWLIKVPFGQSVSLEFQEIDVEKDSSCNYDYISVFNGVDDTYQEIATFCHQIKPVTVTSTGNNMFVKFKADYSYQGRGFTASYSTSPTTCGGLITSPSGYIFSPNYPQNFNKNETCEWLLSIDENHVIELQFENVDLIRTIDCEKNYIKVYDGPNEAYPVLKTMCGNTNSTNETIRSTFEHMFIEFRSDYYLTSKGFKAKYKKACGAKIKTSGSGQIQLKREFDFTSTYVGEDNTGICTYTIEAEDKSKHVTFTVTKMDIGTTWCNDENPVIKLYNGLLNDSPLIGGYCSSKIPPSITSDGSALHIEILREVDLFATYSVLDDHCGGDLQNEGGYMATPGWPKIYPMNAQCSWTIAMGPGNTVNLNFVEFNIPESEHCNTDFLEIRENNATGKLLGVFCGTNTTPNISAIGTLYLMFKSSDLDEEDISTKRGFYAEYSSTSENQLSGPEGYIGNRHYPNFIPTSTYGYNTWLITTNTSTIIELTFVEFFLEFSSSGDCFGNTLKIFDGMDANAPLLKELCDSNTPDSILSTSNMMFISIDFYSSRINTKFLLKWKELSKINQKTLSNKTQSVCGYAYKLDGQTNATLTSPGYPTGYEPNLNCEWIYEIDHQYHLRLRITDLNFGGFAGNRICTYSDVLLIHTKTTKDAEWSLVKEICSAANITDDIIASNLLKVEFKTNRYLNGTGFQADIFGDCGGTLTEPNGVIMFHEDHAQTRTCEWNISVRTGRTIKLYFEEFDLSLNDENCRNYVIVRNGKFPDSPFLGKGKFCGRDRPQDMESTSNHVYIKYSGHSFIKGFKIKYTEVSLDCDNKIRLSSDQPSVEISSPNYPNIPQAHSECNWIIGAPSGESLRIDFEERFDISSSYKCTTDYLELRDGGTTLSPLIGRYCYETPNTLFTTDNMLNIKFFTDSNEPRNGFKAKISISYCGGTFRGAGTINTQEPHVIQAGDNCTWYIKAAVDTYINMEFSLFNVASSSLNCSENVGKVKLIERHPVADENNTEVTLCGQLNKTEYHSTGNEIIVNYLAKSDRDKFILNFKFKKEECGGNLEQETGTLTSPGYPLMNPGNSYCFWKIRVPKGRRISFFTEDIDIDTFTTLLIIFEGFYDGPKILGQKDIKPQHTYETSDNTAHILLWKEVSNSRRGFKIKFTSDKPTICDGDFNATSGQIIAPQYAAPYRCEWKHTKMFPTETLALSIVMDTNATTIGVNLCGLSNTGVHVMDSYNNALGRICSSTNKRPHIFRSTLPITTLMVRQNINTKINFTMSYKTYQCGGILTDDEGVISSPNFPNAATDSVECSWKIELASSRIKINFTTLDLLDDCDKNYVNIYNGQTSLSPIIGKYCKNDHPEIIKSQKKQLLIEYRYVKNNNNINPPKGFSLKYEPEIKGCGGIYQSDKVDIQTPNYGNDYDNNIECIWDVKSFVGNVIKLHFYDRFHIEESENCTKDYVEIFDWNDDNWISLGKKCGRNLPGDILSTNNQLRIIFRSNEKITGSGFRASWNLQCGGILVAAEKERYLMSPRYPYTFISPTINCTYKIISKKREGVVRIKFLDFDLLGTGSAIGPMSSNCAYSNLTIAVSSGSHVPLNSLKQVYCGTDIPKVQRYKNAVIITLMSSYQHSRWLRGFKLIYKDESCGGNITVPTSLELPSTRDDALQLSGYMKFYQPRVSCTWYITAPPNQIPVLSIHSVSMSLGIHCIAQHLEVYDGLNIRTDKRLAQLCGKIEENKPIPATSNTMLVKLDSTAYNFNGFQGEVYFTYGPSVGCGGTINLTETKYINSPNNLPYMDCHWIIVAPRDNKVQIEFTDILVSTSCVNPIRNHTYYCTCSYIEVRDGGGPFADMLAKLCSTDNHIRRTFTTSWNTAYIRLYSAVPQNDMFRVTLKPVQSKCGRSELIATKDFKVLTSPDYPNNYPENIKCTWVIKSSSNTGKFMIHFEEIDISGDSLARSCDSDRLDITEDPNRLIISEGFGPRAKHQVQNAFGASRETLKYAYCDNKTKPFDYYSVSNEVTLTFHSYRYTGAKGKGFKLKYGYSGCNRTIYANEGRIQNDVQNSGESDCVITIIADENKTISIYFMAFYFITSDNTCSKLGLEIRENNSTGRELLKACGFRLPNPVFANTSKLYIRMYNSQLPSALFKYNFLYLSSENGIGCGGKMFNYMGKFSSPMYPNPYRKDIECTWNVMVPKGFKVALKFSDYNIGGACLQNKVVVTTNSEGAESENTFCPEDVPAVLYSESILRITYYSTTNNGGNGWLAAFQAVKEETDNLLWF